MRANTVKHIAEIFKRVNLTELATGDETVDDCGSFSTGVTSGKEPVLSSDCQIRRDSHLFFDLHEAREQVKNKERKGRSKTAEYRRQREKF